MELKREILLIVGSLVALNLLLALGAIGLFVRMGPAIDHIIQENVVSLLSGEEMLVEFALAPGGAPMSPAGRRNVEAAVSRAQENITEAAEIPVLKEIQARFEDAVQGDSLARAVTVAAIRDLSVINRDAMREVDSEARHLGTAGAWAAVLVGFFSFLLSLSVLSRLRKRFIEPLMEVARVLQSVLLGERLRRCSVADAPAEVLQVAEAVNRLLDERLERVAARDQLQHPVEANALMSLLDMQSGPVAVVSQGRIVRASASMLEVLAGQRGEDVRRAARGEEEAPWLRRHQMAEGFLLLG